MSAHGSDADHGAGALVTHVKTLATGGVRIGFAEVEDSWSHPQGPVLGP